MFLYAYLEIHPEAEAEYNVLTHYATGLVLLTGNEYLSDTVSHTCASCTLFYMVARFNN